MTLNDAWPTSFVAMYIMIGNVVQARKALIARVSIAGANDKNSLLYYASANSKLDIHKIVL